MNKIAIAVFGFSACFTLFADLEKKKVTQMWADTNGVLWLRDGKEIMSQTEPSETGYSACWILPRENGHALVLYFKDAKIREINSSLGREGLEMRLSDYIPDGIPETLELVDWKKRKVLEAFTIIDGIVEPVPSEFFGKDLNPFSDIEAFMNYIKSKAEQVRAGQSQLRRRKSENHQ